MICYAHSQAVNEPASLVFQSFQKVDSSIYFTFPDLWHLCIMNHIQRLHCTVKYRTPIARTTRAIQITSLLSLTFCSCAQIPLYTG